MISLPAAAAAVLLLSGCADPASAPGSGGGAPSSATGSPTSSRAVPPRPIDPPDPIDPGGSGAPSGKPTPGGGPVTLDGVVEAGVEPGCRVLTAGGAQYQLLGAADAPLGVPVRVTGVLDPGVLTTCQQGTPIRVTDVRRR